MKTLSINISDLEFSKFGFGKEKFSFSDLVEIISKELDKMKLNDSIELAEKYGHSKMAMDDISNEVNAVRKKAIHRH